MEVGCSGGGTRLVTYDLHPYCTLYRSQAEEEAIREQQLKRAKLLVFSLVPRPPPSLFVCGRAWERG